jgi:hypothetical protein
MRQPINISAGLVALLAGLNLSGCFVARDDGSYHSYRNDLGDLVIDNGVRYVGWCDAHLRDPHCYSGTTVASGRR